jgi:hypothetical protein
LKKVKTYDGFFLETHVCIVATPVSQAMRDRLVLRCR